VPASDTDDRPAASTHATASSNGRRSVSAGDASQRNPPPFVGPKGPYFARKGEDDSRAAWVSVGSAEKRAEAPVVCSRTGLWPIATGREHKGGDATRMRAVRVESEDDVKSKGAALSRARSRSDEKKGYREGDSENHNYNTVAGSGGGGGAFGRGSRGKSGERKGERAGDSDTAAGLGYPGNTTHMNTNNNNNFSPRTVRSWSSRGSVGHSPDVSPRRRTRAGANTDSSFGAKMQSDLNDPEAKFGLGRVIREERFGRDRRAGTTGSDADKHKDSDSALNREQERLRQRERDEAGFKELERQLEAERVKDRERAERARIRELNAEIEAQRERQEREMELARAKGDDRRRDAMQGAHGDSFRGGSDAFGSKIDSPMDPLERVSFKQVRVCVGVVVCA
jgi:hypothetical protein